jgi:hypothetical protein
MRGCGQEGQDLCAVATTDQLVVVVWLFIDTQNRLVTLHSGGREMRVPDGAGTRSLPGFGWESFAWVRYSWVRNGIYPWVSALVIGNLMGRHFWVGCCQLPCRIILYIYIYI